jgi:ribonuclease E
MARERDVPAADDVAGSEKEETPRAKRPTRRGPRRAIKRKTPAAAAADAPVDSPDVAEVIEAPVVSEAVEPAAAPESLDADGLPRKRTRRGRRGGAKRRRKGTANGVALDAPAGEAEIAEPPAPRAPVQRLAPPPEPREVVERYVPPAPPPVSQPPAPVTAWPPQTSPSAARPPRAQEPFGAGLVDSLPPVQAAPPPRPVQPPPPQFDRPRPTFEAPRPSFDAPRPSFEAPRPPAAPPQPRNDLQRGPESGEQGERTGRRRSRRRGGRGRRRNGRERRDGQENGALPVNNQRGGDPRRANGMSHGALGEAEFLDEDQTVPSYPAPALPDEEIDESAFLDEAGMDVIPLEGDESGSDKQRARGTGEASGHTPGGRPVLKPRPARHVRGGRRRRGEYDESDEDSAADRSDHEEELPPVGEDDSDTGEIDLIPIEVEAPKPARRGRRTKKKVAAADMPIPDDELDIEPVMDTPIPAIDMDAGRYQAVKGAREMIMNVTRGAECRVGILNEGRLEELYIERQSAVSHVGNIYMGRITNVEPSIQAAFVDFGMPKNGFLHISDVQPRYFPGGQNLEPEPVGKKVPRRDRPPIQKCFRRGDKVIVQVVKEGVGTKGPTLTTYLSIPGRFVVMMPGMNRLGVSRKIEDDTARRAMRDLLSQLTLPDNMGFILRTAGLDRTRRELQNDLNYLQRLWKTVEERIRSQNAPCELYQESDLVIRTIRDVYSAEFTRIVVDDQSTAEKARSFLRVAMPRTAGNVVEYRRPEPIFHYFGIEEEIRRLHSRHVPLQSGGSIVIDTTEAMVTIDVNSGKFRELQDAEETAFRINIEAAEEIARQLRLRDLGGIVVCDFIDLRLDRHKRTVEKALRDALKKHKERARILRMSKFGIIEMTRQRQRPSIKRSIFVDCPHCAGTGHIKTAESMSLEIIRALQLLANRADIARLVVTLAPSVASLVLNDRRAFLHELEQRTSKTVTIVPEPAFPHDRVTYEGTDYRGMPVRVEA